MTRTETLDKTSSDYHDQGGQPKLGYAQADWMNRQLADTGQPEMTADETRQYCGQVTTQPQGG